MIQVLYFASLRERLGCAEEQLEEVPETVADLLEQLKQRGEIWRQVLSGKVLVAVNHEMASVDARLSEHDEVGLFPPVTGG